jgi:hypothetical protein
MLVSVAIPTPSSERVICRLGLKKLPLLPPQRTMEMMAKAAVAVYEAAVEEHEGRKNGG